jgi:dihydroneopterin aldolase
MLTKLQIKNARYFAFHGVATEEKRLGGRYQVDIDMLYDAKNAIADDAIRHAVNYQDVLYIVSDIIQNESFNLVETLAYTICRNVMDKFSIIEEITVRVRKLNVPVNQYVDFVEAEHTVNRNNEKAK